MSVETKNALYIAMESRWKQCRDCYEGQFAIHREGELYLPRLDGQDDDQYKSYKNRTRFFNAFKRTVHAMCGLSFRKPITIDGDDDLLKNIDGEGSTLDDFAYNMVKERLTTGSFGILVDHPKMPKGLSVAQAEALNARPVFVKYETENIINWEYTTENNVRILKKVVLREVYNKEDDADEFSHDQDERYRVLDLQDGNYRQRVFKDDVQDGADIFPESNNRKMTFIPFIHSGSLLPPLMDLSDNNIKHYQLKADHTHGLRYVALPTPWVTGAEDDEAPTCIGPSKIWRFANPEARVGYLEFTGQGLDALSNEISAIEENMAQLGARLLDPKTVQPNTATAAAINNQDQNASLVNIINDTQDDLNRALAILTEWGNKQDTTIEMSTDFLPYKIDPQVLTAILNAWMQGAISKETMFYNMKAGEMIPDGRTFEQEESLIESNPPPVQDTFGTGNPDEEDEE